jgi:hypothetical protein
MRTKILPPDFVTRFGFMLFCQFDFANRLVKRTFHPQTSPRLAAKRPSGWRHAEENNGKIEMKVGWTSTTAWPKILVEEARWAIYRRD